MNKYIIGLILWFFGVSCGLLINLFGVVYNLGWQESAKKISQDISNARRQSQNVVKKVESIKNE